MERETGFEATTLSLGTWWSPARLAGDKPGGHLTDPRAQDLEVARPTCMQNPASSLPFYGRRIVAGMKAG